MSGIGIYSIKYHEAARQTLPYDDLIGDHECFLDPHGYIYNFFTKICDVCLYLIGLLHSKKPDKIDSKRYAQLSPNKICIGRRQNLSISTIPPPSTSTQVADLDSPSLSSPSGMVYGNNSDSDEE